MPAEESRQEQAHALAVRAREALPQRELAALQPTGVEAAISLLAQAIERLTDDSPHFVLDLEDLDEYGPGQLEALRALRETIGGQSPIRRASRKFVVSFADVELDASDIWDEDEMPENPTPADVIEVMRSGEHSGPLSVACDWVLIESLYVRSGADADADEEVEWDGT